MIITEFVIICFILNTEQLVMCEQCKENLHTDKLARAKRINISFRLYLFRGQSGQGRESDH